MTPPVPDSLGAASEVVAALEALDVRYHVGGSFAASVHGIPRQTQDIDLVVELDQATAMALVARLSGSFYGDTESAARAVARRGSFHLIHLGSGFKVDLFVAGSGAFDRCEQERSRRQVLEGSPERFVWVKSAEDTLLRKLLWYRDGGEVSDRQWADVLGIVQAQGERLDGAYCRQWAVELGVGDLLERALSGG